MFASVFGYIWKKTQTTQTQPSAAATRRSRSFHSRAAAEAANGENHGGASRDSTEDTWSAKFSCSLGDDTFTVTITREYMLINGFEEDATLAAVETWADTVAALGGTAE